MINKKLQEKIDNLYKVTKGQYIEEKAVYNGKFIKVINETYKLPNNKIINRERILIY